MATSRAAVRLFFTSINPCLAPVYLTLLYLQNFPIMRLLDYRPIFLWRLRRSVMKFFRHDFLLAVETRCPTVGTRNFITDLRCASGCVVECRICNREVAGSNLSLGNFAPRSTQPYIPPGSVNEYQLRLRRQRQIWLIPIADERVGVQVKL